ncbi:MAG: acetolactate synthase small subunit [Firmicutes bacterium]|nr:acetolactate synthase small subunit [Bacillota bacterium]
MAKQLKNEIISVLVKNKANVLNRVVNLFGRRGFNIDSLTVSTTNDPQLSRITIAFTATERSLQQIITQTEKLEVVESVTLMDRENSLYRELLLIKINAGPEMRSDIKEIVDIYRAKIVDLSRESLIIELTGTPEKINGFLDVMTTFDIAEVCRTGVTGIEGRKHRKIKQADDDADEGLDQPGGVY